MKSNSSHITDQLLAKFLLGEASLLEQQQVQAWLGESEQNQNYLDQLEAIWVETGKLNPKPVDVDVDKAWNRVEAQLDGRSITMRRALIGIAASIAILLGLFGTYRLLFRTTAPLLLANTTQLTLNDSLPDGSQIVLAQNSTIEYSYNRKNRTRYAKLNGDAYFNVHRDTTQQFIVDVEIGEIQVLGTSFDIKTQQNKDILVDVLSGTVRLCYVRQHGDTLHLIITKGESGLLSATLDTLMQKSQTHDAFFSINRTLQFKCVALTDVFRTIEKCYNVTITFNQQQIGNLMLTSTFKEEDVTSIIQVITSTFNLKYSKNGNEFIIEN